MKKSFKVFLTAVLLVSLAAPASQMSAQARKGATKKTATTRKPAAKSTAAAAKPVDLNGYYYEGILKMKGQPMDMFSAIDFDASQGAVDIAGALTVPASYKATEGAGKITVNLTSDNLKSTLVSKDKGGSLEGSLTLGPNTVTAWYLKVNKEHAVPQLDDSKLEEIVGNPDGYTAFVVAEQGGQKVCFVADIAFDAATKTYNLTFDNAIIQKIFSKLAGPYSVSGKKLNMTNNDGWESTGEIYDDGTYITLPLISAQGFDFSLLLIR